MKFLQQDIAPLGMGCWPIGGEMYTAEGVSLGYSNSNDKESIRAIHAAVANGITLFDTAAAYGAGHSERLLGQALKGNAAAQIATKIGIGIDEATKHLSFDGLAPGQVIAEIDQSLSRLDRDCIDLVLLHINSLPIDQADLLFDEMEKARDSGKIAAYGWSTDFVDRANAMAQRPGFVAIEHAMNVLLDAPKIQNAACENNLYKLIRSPLAMGLLSGKYTQHHGVPDTDIRSTDQGWLQYYRDGKPNPIFMQRFLAVQELLQTGGRTTVQGALCWLWGRSAENIPIPGARTVEQVEGLAEAIQFGALPSNVMAEIETLIARDHAVDAEDRER